MSPHFGSPCCLYSSLPGMRVQSSPYQDVSLWVRRGMTGRSVRISHTAGLSSRQDQHPRMSLSSRRKFSQVDNKMPQARLIGHERTPAQEIYKGTSNACCGMGTSLERHEFRKPALGGTVAVDIHGDMWSLESGKTFSVPRSRGSAFSGVGISVQIAGLSCLEAENLSPHPILGPSHEPPGSWNPAGWSCHAGLILDRKMLSIVAAVVDIAAVAQ